MEARMTKREKVLLLISFLAIFFYISIFEYSTTQPYYFKDNLQEIRYELDNTIKNYTELLNFYNGGEEKSKQISISFVRSLYWIFLERVIISDISMNLNEADKIMDDKFIFLNPFQLEKLALKNKFIKLKLFALNYNLMMININLDIISDAIKYPKQTDPKQKRDKNSTFKSSPL